MEAKKKKEFLVSNDFLEHVLPFLFELHVYDFNEFIERTDKHRYKLRKIGFEKQRTRVNCMLVCKNWNEYIINSYKIWHVSAHFAFAYFPIRILSSLQTFPNLEEVYFHNQGRFLLSEDKTFESYKIERDQQEAPVQLTSLLRSDLIELCNILLKKEKIKKVDFSGSRIDTNKDFDLFTNFIHQCKTLESLVVCGNPFEHQIELEGYLAGKIVSHEHHDHHEHSEEEEEEEEEEPQEDPDPLIQWPTNSSLKHLHLEYVKLNNGDAQMIVDKFPNLEKLALKDCKLNDFLSIKSKTLKELDISACVEYISFSDIDKRLRNRFVEVTLEYLLKDNPNLEKLYMNASLSISSGESISSDSLTHLAIAGCDVEDETLTQITKNCKNLTSLDISVNEDIHKPIIHSYKLKELIAVGCINLVDLQIVQHSDIGIEFLNLSQSEQLESDSVSKLVDQFNKSLKTLYLRKCYKLFRPKIVSDSIEVIDLRHSALVYPFIQGKKLKKLFMNHYISETLPLQCRSEILNNCPNLEKHCHDEKHEGHKDCLHPLQIQSFHQSKVKDDYVSKLSAKLPKEIIRLDTSEQELLENPIIISPNLEELFCTGCINLQSPKIKCENLKKIYFTGCIKLTNEVVQHVIQSCPKLEVLNIYGCCEITEVDVSKYCKNLKVLNAAYCIKLRRLIVKNKQKLTTLAIEGCKQLDDLQLDEHAEQCLTNLSKGYLLREKRKEQRDWTFAYFGIGSILIISLFLLRFLRNKQRD